MSGGSTRLRLRVVPGSKEAGHGSRDKVVEIAGLDRAEAERRLAG